MIFNAPHLLGFVHVFMLNITVLDPFSIGWNPQTIVAWVKPQRGDKLEGSGSCYFLDIQDILSLDTLGRSPSYFLN